MPDPRGDGGDRLFGVFGRSEGCRNRARNVQPEHVVLRHEQDLAREVFQAELLDGGQVGIGRAHDDRDLVVERDDAEPVPVDRKPDDRGIQPLVEQGGALSWTPRWVAARARSAASAPSRRRSSRRASRRESRRARTPRAAGSTGGSGHGGLRLLRGRRRAGAPGSGIPFRTSLAAGRATRPTP